MSTRWWKEQCLHHVTLQTPSSWKRRAIIMEVLRIISSAWGWLKKPCWGLHIYVEKKTQPGWPLWLKAIVFSLHYWVWHHVLISISSFGKYYHCGHVILSWQPLQLTFSPTNILVSIWRSDTSIINFTDKTSSPSERTSVNNQTITENFFKKESKLWAVIHGKRKKNLTKQTKNIPRQNVSQMCWKSTDLRFRKVLNQQLFWLNGKGEKIQLCFLL